MSKFRKQHMKIQWHERLDEEKEELAWLAEELGQMTVEDFDL